MLLQHSQKPCRPVGGRPTRPWRSATSIRRRSSAARPIRASWMSATSARYVTVGSSRAHRWERRGSVCSAMARGCARAWCSGTTHSRISSRRSRVSSPYASPPAAAAVGRADPARLERLEGGVPVLDQVPGTLLVLPVPPAAPAGRAEEGHPEGKALPPGPVRRPRDAALHLRQDAGGGAPERGVGPLDPVHVPAAQEPADPEHHGFGGLLNLPVELRLRHTVQRPSCHVCVGRNGAAGSGHPRQARTLKRSPCGYFPLPERKAVDTFRRQKGQPDRGMAPGPGSRDAARAGAPPVSGGGVPRTSPGAGRRGCGCPHGSRSAGAHGRFGGAPSM